MPVRLADIIASRAAPPMLPPPRHYEPAAICAPMKEPLD